MTDSSLPPSPPPMSGPFAAVPPPTPPAPPPGVPAPAPAYQPIYVHPPRRRRWGLRIALLVLLGGLVFVLVMGGLLRTALEATRGGAFDTQTIMEGDRSQVVAVYDITDMIDQEQADTFSAFARRVVADDNVKAVVLRIDSGGGGVSASDQMNQEVQTIQQAGENGKPVVVSMGGVAASGGYYIAAPANWIVAEHTTITGSIGVISFIPVLKGTLDKIGMETVIIRSTPRKADLNPFEQPTVQARADHQALLDKIHQIFIKVVQDGRGHKLPAGQVAELADGRVWLGQEALDRQLVDQVGYLDDAVAQAASLAGLKDPKAVRYTKRYSVLDIFQTNTARGGLTIDRRLVEDLQRPRIMLLWQPQWE